MGFRFHRAFKLFPGVRINLGKKGASLSLGVRGARVNFGRTGVRTTVGIPGTGLSYSQHSRYSEDEIKERVAAMSNGQRKEFVRWANALPVQYQYDGEVHGPIPIGELATLIVRKKVSEMTYVRTTEEEPWDLIHGWFIRNAQRAESRAIFPWMLLSGISAAILLLIIDSREKPKPEEKPAPVAIASPAPITTADPAPAKATPGAWMWRSYKNPLNK